jgi:hypothetical protein
MLTKNSKKLLTVIDELHSKGIESPSMEDILPNTNMPENEIMLTSLYLHENGYVHVDFGDGSTIRLMELKFKGKNYKELIGIERKSFFFRSIIVPIIVSLVASVLFWLIE